MKEERFEEWFDNMKEGLSEEKYFSEAKPFMRIVWNKWEDKLNVMWAIHRSDIRDLNREIEHLKELVEILRG